jgi:hypothetical protein
MKKHNRNSPPNHHVIFLGAGASFTSGYPLANELRLLLASSKAILGKIPASGIHGDLQSLRQGVERYLSQFDAAIRLCRNGGFATVDEFSKLSSDGGKEHAQQMKILTQMALVLHNPEDKFEESDYYPFIQRLFYEDALAELRDDITILSYNYDCYLDYLLVRASSNRMAFVEPLGNEANVRNSLTSGFDNLTKVDWLSGPKGFRHFKLHGTIGASLGGGSHYHKLFFSDNLEERFRRLTDGKTVAPIILFPWEIFDDNGKFVSSDKFVFNQTNGIRWTATASGLYDLYKNIWQAARDAVQQATKISFIGLSAHAYMEPGWKYLFEGKETGVQVVVASKANEKFTNSRNRLHRASLCGRVSEMLRRVAPKMSFTKSFQEQDGVILTQEMIKPGIPLDITPRLSFDEFIQTEM